jgi:hypothetical protein
MANWSPSTSNANIPGWENTELNYLSSKGMLYGLPPGLIGAIDQAESSGQGGSINSAGYGGFFGLGANSSYGPYTDTPSLLQGTNALDFGDQAATTAYEFNQLLQRYGGNVYEAEQAYQTGGASGFGEGDSVFQQLGVPGTLASDPNAGASGSLAGVLQGLLGGANVTNQALSQQQALGGAQQSITDQQLLQQLQDTLKALGLSGQSLGIQKTGLQEQGKYEAQEGALQKAQARNTWQNLQKQLGIETTQAQEGYQQGLHDVTTGNAASGILNTGTTGYEKNVLGENLANTMAGIGLQRTQGQEAYNLGWEGINVNYGYQQQQLQNALKQLGIQQQQLGLQGTEAQQQYQFGVQGAGNQYADLLNSILMQQGQNQMGLGGNIGQLLQQLLGAGSFSGTG